MGFQPVTVPLGNQAVGYVVATRVSGLPDPYPKRLEKIVERTINYRISTLDPCVQSQIDCTLGSYLDGGSECLTHSGG